MMSRKPVCAYIVEAFSACGGGPGKAGFIDRKVLEEIIKTEFEMTINIKEMLDKVDDNGDGEIEYKEFKSILDEGHKHKMKKVLIKP